MTKWKRNLAAVLAAGALLVAVVATQPQRTDAANLTGGQYTYVVNGDEVTFSYDPVVRKAGMLLPVEVFTQLGIKVEGATTKNLQLVKNEVAVKVSVGSTSALVNAKPRSLSTVPLRLNGRVFIPAEVLKDFGVEYEQEGNFVSLRTLTDVMPVPRSYDAGEWSDMVRNRNFSRMVKVDSNLFISSDWHLLSSAMINSTNLGFDYGTRARLNSLLPTNTLVMVSMSNSTGKSGALVTGTTYLVDDKRNQYEVVQVVDIGQGLLSSKLAPAANRTGVLVFPKLNPDATLAWVYYESNQEIIGTFNDVK